MKKGYHVLTKTSNIKPYFKFLLAAFVAIHSCLLVDAQSPDSKKIDHLKTLLNEDLTPDSAASVYSMLGEAYFKTDSFFQAIVNTKIAADFYQEKNNLEKYCRTLEVLGDYYYYINDFKHSLKYSLNALKILEEQNKKDARYYKLIMNIGTTYFGAEEDLKAISYFKNSLTYFERDTASSKVYLTVIYIDLGGAYKNIGMVDSAFYYYFKALTTSKKYDIKEYTGAILVNLGDLYKELKVYKKAKPYFLDAMAEFNKKKNEKQGYWYAVFSLAVVEKELNNPDVAIDSLTKAINFFLQRNDLLHLRDSYQILSEIYKEKNDLANSLKYANLCSTIKDSIIVSNQKSSLTELQMQYELQKIDIESTNQITLLKKDAQLKIYKVYSIIGLLIIGILVILFYLFRMVMKKRYADSMLANAQMQQKQLENEIEYKNKELENFALHIVQKNDFLGTIKSSLTDLKGVSEKDMLQNIKTIILQITQSIRQNNDLKKFQEKIDQVHGNFIKQLRTKFPDLTEKEIRLCVLLKLNLSSKEIATLNNISENAIEMARYRMRKKMGLNTEENLTDFIQRMNS